MGHVWLPTHQHGSKRVMNWRWRLHSAHHHTQWSRRSDRVVRRSLLSLSGVWENISTILPPAQHMWLAFLAVQRPWTSVEWLQIQYLSHRSIQTSSIIFRLLQSPQQHRWAGFTCYCMYSDCQDICFPLCDLLWLFVCLQQRYRRWIQQHCWVQTGCVGYVITAFFSSSCKCRVYVKIAFIIACMQRTLVLIDFYGTISLKLTSNLYYSAGSSCCFLFLMSVSPALTLSRSESESNIKLECVAPTQTLLITQWLRNREPGKKGRRRRRLSTSNQQDYWERQREDVELWALWPLSRTDLFWFNY